MSGKHFKSKNYFMKKAFLFVLSLCMLGMAYSQSTERYTVSGGILGAINASEFKAKGTNPTGVDYNFEAGWSLGGWLNFPLGTRFSLEPQVMYSSYGYHANTSTALLLNDGKIKYISVPMILKLHAGEKLAITAGPQVDFFTSFEDEDHSTARTEDNFKQTSWSIFGGLELFPRGRVTIFGRYIHGISDMDVTGTFGENLNYRNQAIQAGLKLRLFGGAKPYLATTTPLPPAPVDTDGDGITDDVDKCPNEKGTAKYNGCPIPDSDKDGINDEEDKCPSEAGTAKYNGCPVPDSDKDGINDELDKCPNEAGPASNNGCPEDKDRDDDGIDDEKDKCPDVPGVAANNGCPDLPADVSKLLSASNQSMIFTTNSAKLSTAANTSLNKVVTALKEHPEMKVKLEGHADNMEKEAETMSEQRATAVKNYLISKGISADRITVEGFGNTSPMSDNGTSAGRAKNRRVEIKIVY